jgi:hypothetical protein
MTVGKNAIRKKTASGISTPAQNGDELDRDDSSQWAHRQAIVAAMIGLLKPASAKRGRFERKKISPDGLAERSRRVVFLAASRSELAELRRSNDRRHERSPAR